MARVGGEAFGFGETEFLADHVRAANHRGAFPAIKNAILDSLARFEAAPISAPNLASGNSGGRLAAGVARAPNRSFKL
jgi:hypothetical protein